MERSNKNTKEKLPNYKSTKKVPGIYVKGVDYDSMKSLKDEDLNLDEFYLKFNSTKELMERIKEDPDTRIYYLSTVDPTKQLLDNGDMIYYGTQSGTLLSVDILPDGTFYGNSDYYFRDLYIRRVHGRTSEGVPHWRYKGIRKGNYWKVTDIPTRVHEELNFGESLDYEMEFENWAGSLVKKIVGDRTGFEFYQAAYGFRFFDYTNYDKGVGVHIGHGSRTFAAKEVYVYSKDESYYLTFRNLTEEGMDYIAEILTPYLDKLLNKS